MATRVRSNSPQVEPFPSLEVPHTPTSASHSVFAISKEGQHLLRPHATEHPSASPKSSVRYSPRPLTGVAAVADARRLRQQQHQQQDHEHVQTSANPAITALHALSASPISKASNLSSPNHHSTIIEMRKPSTHLTVPVTTTAETSQPSPVSLRSFGDSDAVSPNGAMTATSHEQARDRHLVAEPTEMSAMDYAEPTRAYNSSSNTHSSHKAFTYPGPSSVAAEAATEGQSRASPSTKRHKCPYCATDFTRHHNLKSHLLTHSQEKPYVCQTCQSRFRRLHDLKRHTKLHTGERPHICDKCGRRFARGDALARHNKGPGGCAGRRSSFGGDDDSRMGDDNMDGMEYGDHGENGHDLDDEDDGPRRESEPSRKRAHIEDSHDSDRSIYRQHSSTYPPPLSSRSMHRGNMGPPSHNILPSSGNVTSPGEISNLNTMNSVSSNLYGSNPSVVLGEGGISHSPKPLSPNQQAQHRLSIAEATNPLRNRSPSLSQLVHNGRGGQPTPPTIHQMPQHTQLPSLAGLASGQSMRLPIQSTTHNSMHNSMQSAPIHTSNPSSLSSHGQSSGGSMREIVGDDVWAYVRNLEQRFSRMQDEYELRISRLQEDLIAIKGHLSSGFQPR
jgi:hypothetical protein